MNLKKKGLSLVGISVHSDYVYIGKVTLEEVIKEKIKEVVESCPEPYYDGSNWDEIKEWRDNILKDL